jgi:hypothetical protein
VEPVRPRPPAGDIGDIGDVAPRTTVTVRPLFTYLLNFDGLLGLFAGAILLGVCGFAGAPAGVQVTVGLVSFVAIWIASWLRTAIRFTTDDIVVTMLLWPFRARWARVSSVTFHDEHHDDARPAEVTSRRVSVRYRRDLSTPTGPVPATLGEFRPWDRRHFRTLSLPLAFPPPADPLGSGSARTRKTWFGRHADRQRQTIREEFAAHGYPLPE